MRTTFLRSYLVQGCLLFTLAMTYRTTYLVITGKLFEVSHVEVERAAVTWATQGRLADAFGDGTGPTAHVPPLYTGLLAGVHKVFGIDSPATVAVQRLLSTAACALGIALLPWLARRAGLGNNAGLLAGLFLSLYPYHLFIETYGRQEGTYAVLLSMCLFAVWLRLRDSGWTDRKAIWIFALLNGITALTSPAPLVFSALAMACDFLFLSQQRAAIFRSGALVAGVAGLMLTPWIIRNYIELGGFVPLRSNFGLELYVGNNPAADGLTLTLPRRVLGDKPIGPHPYINPDERRHLIDMGELAYMHEKQDMALTYIKEHPARFAELTANRIRYWWFPPFSSWNPEMSGNHFRTSGAWAIAGSSLIGLALLFWTRHRNRWPLALILFAPSLVYLVTHVNARYRYITIWTMALLGGYVATTLWAFLRAATVKERSTLDERTQANSLPRFGRLATPERRRDRSAL